jgi:hypothetical protein
MSHITGHVDDSASSCGILTPNLSSGKDDCRLYFIPPSNWTPQSGEDVEFDLIDIPVDGGESIPVAYDLIQIKGVFNRKPADPDFTERIRKYANGVKKEGEETNLEALRRLKKKPKVEEPVSSNGH